MEIEDVIFTHQNKKLITVNDAAEILGIKHQQVRNYHAAFCDKNKLPVKHRDIVFCYADMVSELQKKFTRKKRMNVILDLLKSDIPEEEVDDFLAEMDKKLRSKVKK